MSMSVLLCENVCVGMWECVRENVNLFAQICECVYASV